MSAKHHRPTPINQAADQTLVDDIAWALIRKHGITIEDFMHDGHRVANGWGGRVEQLCLRKAMKLNGQTLGRIIVAFKQADLYHVHSGTWLGKYESGPYLLQQIAATAIVWRIQVAVGARGFTYELYTNHDELPWDVDRAEYFATMT